MYQRRNGTVSTVRDSLRGSHRLSTSIVWCENGAVSIAYIVLSVDFISTLYREADQQNCNRWKQYRRQGSHPATWKYRWGLRTPKSYSHCPKSQWDLGEVGMLPIQKRGNVGSYQNGFQGINIEMSWAQIQESPQRVLPKQIWNFPILRPKHFHATVVVKSFSHHKGYPSRNVEM